MSYRMTFYAHAPDSGYTTECEDGTPVMLLQGVHVPPTVRLWNSNGRKTEHVEPVTTTLDGLRMVIRAKSRM